MNRTMTGCSHCAAGPEDDCYDDCPTRSGYVCGVCHEPIVDEEPHTDPETGEDVHPACCPLCADALGRACDD